LLDQNFIGKEEIREKIKLYPSLQQEIERIRMAGGIDIIN